MEVNFLIFRSEKTWYNHIYEIWLSSRTGRISIVGVSIKKTFVFATLSAKQQKAPKSLVKVLETIDWNRMKALSIPMKTLHLGFGTPFEANEANNLIQNPSAWKTNKKMHKPGSQLGCYYTGR